MAAQPFYHRVTMLFTATEELSEQDVLQALRAGLGSVHAVVQRTIEIEEFEEPEAGDPSDL